MDCSTAGFSVLYYVLEFPQTHVLWVGDAVQPSHLLLLPSPPALNLSQHQGLFQWVSFSHQEAKYWSFSFSISPSSEYSGLISFRTNWLDLLAVQGILKSLLQHYSSKASIFFWHLAFFMVQLAYLYSTAGKTIVLTTGTFVSKARSRLVIAFLPRSKHLLILWLQSSSTVILEPKKIKSATVSTSPPVLRLIHVIVAIKSVGGYLPGSSVKTLGFHCRGRRT